MEHTFYSDMVHRPGAYMVHTFPQTLNTYTVLTRYIHFTQTWYKDVYGAYMEHTFYTDMVHRHGAYMLHTFYTDMVHRPGAYMVHT